MNDTEQISLSEELITVMRAAVAHALRLKEPVVTPRSLLLALLDDEYVGAALAELLDREKLEAQRMPPTVRLGMTRLPEFALPPGEAAALARYDTLAFKSPDGKTTLWLNRVAYSIFLEGAQRAGGRYMPKHLGFGVASEATRSPNVFSSLRVEPGKITDALLKL